MSESQSKPPVPPAAPVSPKKPKLVRWTDDGTLELRDGGGTMYVIGKEAPLVAAEAGQFYERADRDRAIACLNACAGIADPSAVPDVIAAATYAQCQCSLAERDSGHRGGCWMPELSLAIAKTEGRS